MSENLLSVKRMIEDVWNKENLALLPELVAETCRTYSDEQSEPEYGGVGLFNAISRMKTCAADLTFAVEEQFERDGKTFTVWSAKGTSCRFGADGTFFTNPVELHGEFVAKVDQGKIYECWGLAKALTELEVCHGKKSQDWLNADLRNVQVRVSGKKAGVPLVFLANDVIPGWKNWQRFTRIFEGERPVVNVSLMVTQAAIQKRALPQGYSLAMEIGALSECLAKAGVPAPYDLVGWSMGAIPAIDLAANFPELVRTMALVEPSLVSCLEHDSGGGQLSASISKRLSGYSTNGIVSEDQLATFLIDVGNFRETEEARAHEFWPLWCAYRQVLHHRPGVWKHIVNDQKLSSIQLPLLMFKGDSSLEISHTIIGVLEKKIRQSSIVVLNGMHRCYLEDREKFVENLKAFYRAADSMASRKAA